MKGKKSILVCGDMCVSIIECHDLCRDYIFGIFWQALFSRNFTFFPVFFPHLFFAALDLFVVVGGDLCKFAALFAMGSSFFSPLFVLFEENKEMQKTDPDKENEKSREKSKILMFNERGDLCTTVALHHMFWRRKLHGAGNCITIYVMCLRLSLIHI